MVTQTINYTGASQTFSMPGCSSATITCYGGKGANGVSTASGAIGGAGGNGAMVSGVFTFSASTVLTVNVGGASTGSLGGFNGGGNGGSALFGGVAAAGGGGASDVRFLGNLPANRIIVASGGGGNAGCGSSTLAGGAGGNGGAFPERQV